MCIQRYRNRTSVKVAEVSGLFATEVAYGGCLRKSPLYKPLYPERESSGSVYGPTLLSGYLR